MLAISESDTAAAPTHPRLAPAGDELTVGQLVGRFVILNRLGAGGMGIVYAAYDPELDRKVALKLIRPGLHSADDAPGLQMRLVREAQSMARVAHPNVAAVYDVGRHGEQVFVAMELIDGETLARWLSRTPRSTAEIVAVFAHAGRGLAAAHSAGLTHRDFKPNNVMVDRQGRVRVLDFGLARPMGAGESATPVSVAARVDLTLTASGALLGTPAYMSPEQLTGGAADVRSDQFAFCVALYEALAGTRPFAGDDTEKLRAAILAHELVRPRRSVPAWLLKIVTRGLGASPSERWPSMDALLAALERDPTRSRWRVATAVAVMILAVAGVIGYRHAARTEAAVCGGAEERVAGVWSPARRQAVQAAFEKSGVPYAAPSFATVAGTLDRYTAAWASARTDACRATRVRGEQSDELLDLRMQCLDNRLGQLGSLIELFTHADRKTVDHAVEAAAQLAPLAGCADAEELRRVVHPPRDPSTRARVDALERRRQDLVALDATGNYPAALALAEPLWHDATQLGYAPLIGQVGFQLGAVYHKMGRPEDAARVLEDAALQLVRARDDRMAARAWAMVGFAVGSTRDAAKPDEALRFLSYARAELDRLGAPDDDLEGFLAGRTAPILSRAKRFDEAYTMAQKAVALRLGPSPTSRALRIDVANLATIVGEVDRLGEAIPLEEEVLAAIEKERGATHPDVEILSMNLAVDLIHARRDAEALPLLDRVIERVRARSPGPSEELAERMIWHAEALVDLGRYDEALAESQGSLAMLEKLPSAEPLSKMDALADIGRSQLGLGRLPEARATVERMLPLLEVGKATAFQACEARFVAAQVLYAAGQHDRARQLAALSRDAYRSRSHQPGGYFYLEHAHADRRLARVS